MPNRVKTDATLEGGDIELGAVEIKNASSDTRATVLAASTASQATNTPLVVALHPSSPLGAGSAIMGKVGIDQTTPGTTNGVQVNAALPAGSNIVGKVGIDQTTNGTTNAVALTGYSFANITTSTTTTVKSGSGVLHAVIVNTKGTVASTTTIYDNTAGSGTIIGIIDSLTLAGTFQFDINFATGLTLVTTGTVAPNITVSYR